MNLPLSLALSTVNYLYGNKQKILTKIDLTNMNVGTSKIIFNVK
jgi:hypothetical protein